MRYKDVIKHFGSAAKAEAALHICRKTIYAWKYRKRIPYATQCAIQVKTGSALMADVRES